MGQDKFLELRKGQLGWDRPARLGFRHNHRQRMRILWLRAEQTPIPVGTGTADKFHPAGKPATSCCQARDDCLDYLREGDTLVVTRIDRLSRSLRDLQNLVHELEGQNIKLRATEQAIDTSSASGKAFLDMLGVFAEFETHLRQELQREGIAWAKAKGAYKGRKPTAQAKAQQVIELMLAGLTREAVAGQLGIGRASVYRILKTWRLHHPDAILPGERVKPSLSHSEPEAERAMIARCDISAISDATRDCPRLHGYSFAVGTAGHLRPQYAEAGVRLLCRR
ncbi:site-specific DNA recombinase [Photorhabdus temperata subsp. temperata M1021]|nr:site-specific DNA recombinase [Photorhabdus temperata subsp. temperata M1021]